jgi:hypothetical protein
MANVLDVTMSGDIAGEKVVMKQLDGGRIVLAPIVATRWCSRSVAVDPATAADLEEHLGARHR